MTLSDWVGLVLTAALLVYLFLSLLRSDKVR